VVVFLLLQVVVVFIWNIFDAEGMYDYFVDKDMARNADRLTTNTSAFRSNCRQITFVIPVDPSFSITSFVWIVWALIAVFFVLELGALRVYYQCYTFIRAKLESTVLPSYSADLNVK